MTKPRLVRVEEKRGHRGPFTLRTTAIALVVVCVVLAMGLFFPLRFSLMTSGKDARVCSDQRDELAAFQNLTYDSQGLSFATLWLEGATPPYTADEFGMAQQNTTRFHDEDGNTLFYVTTSNDWGGLVGITDAASDKTVVYRIR